MIDINKPKLKVGNATIQGLSSPISSTEVFIRDSL